MPTQQEREGTPLSGHRNCSDCTKAFVQNCGSVGVESSHCPTGVTPIFTLSSVSDSCVLFPQMDDIDAMFSDLLGEMDLLTQVGSHRHYHC